MEHIKALIQYNKSGLCAVPVSLSDKYPSMLSGWRKYMSEKPTDYDIRIWRNYSDVERFGVCLICGAISGNLEVIDIDNHLNNAAEIFAELISIGEVSAIIQKYDIPIESTKSGGYHLFYRCKEIGANQKLAIDQKTAIIETRAEGGLIVCAPSKGYELNAGDLNNIPEITASDRDLLLSYCRSFDKSAPIPDGEKVKQSNFAMPESSSPFDVSGERPGDIYNRQNVAESKSILEAHGWKCLGGKFWRRPGKDSGVSATFGHVAQDVFYVFSANAHPFSDRKCYHPFDILTHLEFGGDYTRSARSVAEKLNLPKKNDQTKQRTKSQSKNLTASVGHVQSNQVEESDAQTHEIWVVNNRGKIKVDFHKTKIFLQDNGFFRYEINKDKFMFVRVINGVVTEKNYFEVRDFILKYLEKIGRFDCYNEFMDSGKYTASNLLNLDTININWLRDKKHSSYVFYRNCIAEATPSGIIVRNYGDIPGLIWESQILKRDFILMPEHEADLSDVAKFCSIISNKAEDRIQAYRASLGYLINGYKNAAYCPVIVYNDENATDEPTGGTGKGLSFKFAEQLRNAVIVDGKNLDMKGQFSLQRVNQDTSLILIDDIERGFNFESLFSIVTSGMAINKKYVNEIFLSFDDAPKIAITTNYPIKSKGDSFVRRLFEIEIYKHFTPTHTPSDEFGRDMFSDWDYTEWSRFDNWMMYSAVCYLKNGLNKPSYATLAFNKLKAETHRDFVPFAQAYIFAGSRHRKKDLIQKFRDEADEGFYRTNLGTRKFCDWCESWAKYNGWEFFRDIGAGREYIEFVDPNDTGDKKRIGTTDDPIPDDEMPF